MRATFFIAAALLLHSATVSAVTADTPVSGAQFGVVKAEFGLLNPSESPRPGFQRSTKVPLKEGQSYGWIVELFTSKDKIKWREEFSLPTAPETWGSDETEGLHRISADRKTSVIEREVRVERGLIYNFWQVHPGDPKGRYSIRVFVDGILVSSFEFDVD